MSNKEPVPITKHALLARAVLLRQQAYAAIQQAHVFHGNAVVLYCKANDLIESINAIPDGAGEAKVATDAK